MLATRIEQGDKSSAPIARDVRSLRLIARAASQASILRGVAPSVLLRNDVFDVEREDAVVLMQMTILATMTGSSPDHAPRSQVHRVFRDFARSSRAFDLSVEMNVS
jgi:hypothetical protein